MIVVANLVQSIQCKRRGISRHYLFIVLFILEVSKFRLILYDLCFVCFVRKHWMPFHFRFSVQCILLFCSIVTHQTDHQPSNRINMQKNIEDELTWDNIVVDGKKQKMFKCKTLFCCNHDKLISSSVFRLWAEVFHVSASGAGTVKWQQVSEDLVPVNITCIQDSPECVFHITAYNSQVDKILDVRLVQPGKNHLTPHTHTHTP